MRANGGSRNGDAAARARTAARFARVELRYGRHEGPFELGSAGAPFVIVGPNGSGKSTLIEGIVRTLFGFRRSRKEDRETHRRRRPWSGGAYGGRLELETPGGRWIFERDFETDRVRVVAPGSGEAPRFEGEANPNRAGEAIRTYRALLEEALGLTELDDYRRTACVFQGGLPSTSLGPDLLQVAAGGHADVESARSRIIEEYQSLTVAPIDGGSGRRRKPGAIETLAAEVAELEAAVREARAAEARRGPRVRERDERRARLETIEGELERLEAAFEVLSEAARLEEVAGSSRARIRRLERWIRELDEALARYDLVEDRDRPTAAARFPSDFGERARALEVGLWPRRDALRAELAALAERDAAPPGRGARRMLVGALGLLVASAALWWTGFGLPAGLALGLALTAAGLALREREAAGRGVRSRRRSRERLEADLDEVERDIARTLEGVPDAERLDRASLAVARERFERQAADREALRECERGLRAAIDHASRELEEAGDPESRARSAERVPGGLRERARDRLRLLHEGSAREREEVLAPLKLRLEEMRRVRFELPDGVEATVEGVRAARRDRLAACERLRSELTAIERQLAVEARPEASAVSLEADLDAARTRLDGLEARAAAYREAYRLLDDAYDSFRRSDEDRLVGDISSHLEALSAGMLGPLDASQGLADARLRLGDRAAAIEAPPLSYGQLHAAFLAIRMGAADFLAGLGVRVPLLIDDPFVHLDERRAGRLWEILARASAERQVIIATQDRLLLDHLGIAPDLDLAASSVAPGAPATPPSPPGGESEPSKAPAEPDPTARIAKSGEEAPDLWSQLDG